MDFLFVSWQVGEEFIEITLIMKMTSDVLIKRYLNSCVFLLIKYSRVGFHYWLHFYFFWSKLNKLSKSLDITTPKSTFSSQYYPNLFFFRFNFMHQLIELNTFILNWQRIMILPIVIGSTPICENKTCYLAGIFFFSHTNK